MPAAELLALLPSGIPRSRPALDTQTQVNLPPKEQKYEALFQEMRDLADRIARASSTEQKWALLAERLYGLDIDLDKFPWRLTRRLQVMRLAHQQDFLPHYMPQRIIQRLFPPDSPDARITDPLDLFIQAFGSNSTLTEQVVWRAQRDIIIAVVNLGELIAADKCEPAHRRNRQGYEHFWQITNFLAECGLLKDVRKGVTIRSRHDPHDEYRAVWVEGIHQNPEPSSLPLYRTKVNTAMLWVKDRWLPVLLATRRRKGFFQALGKMYAIDEPNFYQIYDQCGICITHRSIEEMREAAEFIRETLPDDTLLDEPHFPRDRWEQYRDRTEQPPNPYSAPNFVYIVYYRHLGNPRRRYEVHHRLAAQHLDLIYCSGPENHTLYHLRQYTDRQPQKNKYGLYHHLHTPAYTGFGWHEDQLKTELARHIAASRPSPEWP